ncbi:MAG TPA: histidine triad nucleotide-binding protein [Spirochaetota bacterium]|nr:histidine triad nucleotide-binding protein [Spirochaetota bacterium]
MECLFCRIIKGEVPSTKVYETDKVVAFKDINPQAPVHILVIHMIHTPSVSETPSESSYIFADMFDAVREIAKKFDLDTLGYRMIINNGKASGQLVFHVHIHILGGQENLGPLLSR